MNAGNSVFISCEKMKGYSEMKDNLLAQKICECTTMLRSTLPRLTM
ncbi:unnamed protein product [Nezara viridula]|uniref:Uncharacterized protein n=1 Tax=Nezara viridula TaxID=85310 RepID=A0A9P0HC22_NEZVI|nr:unnamed protein product [Nezara viridula]